MNRPWNYRLKTLKQLFEAYSFENGRINKEDARITKEYIKNEILTRVNESFKMLEDGESPEYVLERFINH